jgi:hypothetical protein
MPPGEGDLPLRELLLVLLDEAALSVEVPMTAPRPNRMRAGSLWP